MRNVAHIVRSESMALSGSSASAEPAQWSRDGDIRTVRVAVKLTEDPQATANFVSITLFGLFASTDNTGFVYGTFDETETAFNIGDTSTLAWSWSEPATGDFYAELAGIPMMPIMGVVWSAGGTNTADVWILW